MAMSWQRLIDGNDIREMDMVMIKHELLECDLMNKQGFDYRTAHGLAESVFDYTKYTKELDRREGLQ